MSNNILRIDNLNVSFKQNRYGRYSWRDWFVEKIHSPLSLIHSNEFTIHVLKSVSFAMEKGVRLALIGRNGSGKTTLCRALFGLLAPASGTIAKPFGTRALFNTSAGMYPELTGRENITLLAHFMYPDQSEQKIEEIVEDSLAFSDLKNYLDAPFFQYSRGMQTRLYLSLASAMPAPLLILDEVLDGADAVFQKKMEGRLTKIIADSGAVIIISHSEEQARRYCTKGMVLKDGYVAYHGPIDYAHKAYLFFNQHD